ncbi:hypothetical protein HUS93_33700, partial [Pseudomonas protegens]|nr:hypothetical protein [Pseudomonas protegens]
MTDSSPDASPSSLKIYFRLLGYVRPYIGLFLISIPTLIALCTRPSELKSLLREPVFIAMLLFCTWAIVSLAW